MSEEREEKVHPTWGRGQNAWREVTIPPASHTATIEDPGAPPSNGRASEEFPSSCETIASPSVAMGTGPTSVSDLADIRAVAFCCDACQTVVSLPRIRWANSPEQCPNCGARWMSKPSADPSFPEDDPTYVYRVVSAFRESLQKLIGVRQTAVFHFLIEIGESTNQAKRNPTETRRKGKKHV